METIPETDYFFEIDNKLYEYKYLVTTDNKYLKYIRHFNTTGKFERLYTSGKKYKRHRFLTRKEAIEKHPQYFI